MVRGYESRQYTERFKEVEMTERPIPKRSAIMWYRDLCASVELLSEPADVQLAKMRQLQLNSDELRERFQLEWGGQETAYQTTPAESRRAA